MTCAANSSPQIRATRCNLSSLLGAAPRLHTFLPLWMSAKATSKRDSAMRSSMRTVCWYSVFSVRKNLRRAGTLKNKSRTSTRVPNPCDAGAGALISPSRASTTQACTASAVRDASDKRETEPILGSASPRKPKVATFSRSCWEAILLVACRARARLRSEASMPAPSSETRISPQPPRSSSTSMRRAPASRAFSTNSLTTEAGRSITSPAAI